MFGFKSLAFVTELIEAGKFASDHNLMVSSCGNLSMKVSKNAFAITASGSHLGSLNASDIALCSLSDISDYDGPKPSIETSFHRNIFNVRDDVGSILHFQSPYATTLACAEDSSFDLSFIRAGSTPLAVINDERVTIGDVVGGATVVSIDRSGVMLSINGEERRVSLYEDGLKVPATQ